MFRILGWLTVSILALSPQLLTAQSECGSVPPGFSYVQNWNRFSVLHGGQQRPVRMADPTILPLDQGGQTVFYVSGTSDDYLQGNFPIFRSTDLYRWEFHATAFAGPHDGPFPTGSLPSEIELHGRTFAELWSPQLYVDPKHAGSANPPIFLAFSAAENPDPSDLASQQRSVFLASVLQSDFIAGKPFATVSWEPLQYYYRLNNNGLGFRDGGYQQRLANGHGTTIPVTGIAADAGAACGDAVKLPSGWEHGCQGTNTWMFDAPFVFFDPNDGYRGWMTYTWHQVYRLGSNTFNGNNIAAYPMLDNIQLDALRSGDHIPLFYRYNNHGTPFPGPAQAVPNGALLDLCSPTQSPCPHVWPERFWWKPWAYWGPPGVPSVFDFAGVAEGSAAFFYGDRYYVFGTRNPWDGPAYMMTYRSVPTSSGRFAASRLPSWSAQDVAEEVLVAGNWISRWNGTRDTGNRESFGHGEVFWAFGRPYLVFHAKLHNSPERRIYFKELCFQDDGSISRLWDGHPSQAQDLNVFLSPTP